MKKKLNVGLIGYGFMGRTHSNAYCKVNNFFDLPYVPVRKVICGLEEKEAKAFAELNTESFADILVDLAQEPWSEKFPY